VRKIYWFVVRPERKGAKCVITCGEKILLIKLSYAHKKWTVPGGRVGKDETHEDAAKREVLEEVGILLDSVRKIGSYFHDLEYKKDTIHCFHGEAKNYDFRVDELEVVDAKWFYPHELPHDLGIQARRVVRMYLESKT
jgi:8-oxo-dGTP pyrophosphatase MutT (NUDIX family)